MVIGKHFTKYYFKYILFFALGIGVLIFIDIRQLDIPNLLGQIITSLEEFTHPDSGVIPLPGSTLALNAFDHVKGLVWQIIKVVGLVTIGRFIWRMLIFGTSRRIEYDLRNVMFKHATELSQDFYSHEKVGGMMTYFINDLSAIRMAYGPGIMMLVDTIVIGSVAITRMAGMDVKMTLIAIIPMSFMVVAMYFLTKSMRKQFRRRQEKFRDLSDYTQENFSGIDVIKAYTREFWAALTFREKGEELYDANIKYVLRSTWTGIVTSIAVNAVVISILGYGSVLIIKGNFTTGQLVEYTGYFFALMWPIRALVRFVTISTQAQASARRVGDFLDSEISVKDKSVNEDIEKLVPSIKLQNLDFAYPDDNIPILKNISFEIEAGEMVGILGRTGSGKTTIVDLLLRVYNVEKGEMFVGGYDIMDIPLKQLRDTVGYVPQDNFLFSDTISNNIAFAFEHLSDDKIVEAAKLSDIYGNIVEFKEGFDTVLGERGVTVSGGQKQRISIARALAKNPDILILDDSVSAVDTKTEETIISNLYDLRKGKTTIFIAHRISTVKNMDKIILIDDGEIRAIGTHDSLLETSAMYKDLVDRQMLDDMDEDGDIDA